MRILDARIHAILDVALVLAFFLGPLAFGLGGSPAILSFLLAFVFLILVVVRWSPARRAAASIPVAHGLIELAITIFLVFLPRIDGYAPGSPARRFVWIMAAVVGVIWLLSAYGDRAVARTATSMPAGKV